MTWDIQTWTWKIESDVDHAEALKLADRFRQYDTDAARESLALLLPAIEAYEKLRSTAESDK